MLSKKKIGASILEVLIAASILSIAALAYAKLQVFNFTTAAKSYQIGQATNTLSDLSEIVRLYTGNRLPSSKLNAIHDFTNSTWIISKKDCDTIPSFVIDCLNETNDDLELCNENKMQSLEIFNVMCNTFSASSQSVFNLSYCTENHNKLCAWISIDGIKRTESECRLSLDSCAIMEITP